MRSILLFIVVAVVSGFSSCGGLHLVKGFYNMTDEPLMFAWPTYSSYPDTTFRESYPLYAEKVDGGKAYVFVCTFFLDDWGAYFHEIGTDTLSLYIWRGYDKDESELGGRKLQMMARYDLSADDMASDIRIVYPPSREMLNAGMKVTLIPEEESDSYPGFLEAYAPGRASEE